MTRKEVANLNDARIRDIAGNNNVVKIELEQARQAAKAAEGAATRQAAGERQTERLGAAEHRLDVTEGGKDRRLGATEGGKDRRLTEAELGKDRRQAAQIAQRDKALQTRVERGDGLSPQDTKDLAAGIATYNLAPATGRGKNQIMAEVLRINPSYNQQLWTGANKSMRDFLAGPEGRAIRFVTVARGHMDKLQELANALKNYDTKILNRIGNEYGVQTGDDAQTNYQIAASAVGSEIVKAIVASGNSGAGSMHERQAMAEKLSMNLAPKQFEGAFKTLNDLIDQQVGGLKQQYEASGHKDFDQRWPRLSVTVTPDKTKLAPGWKPRRK